MVRLTLGLALVLLASVCWGPSPVSGHGRLMEPPSRGSMWRVGFNTPPDYDDNQLFCGGANYQWQQHGGKCGICGDPWGGPRDHEAGGKFATGTISRTYAQAQTVQVDVHITAHHKGYFEFRLCPHNDPSIPATQACLDQHLLPLADGSGTRYLLPGSMAGHYEVQLRLPADVVCSQCVFQWKYNTGNSLGTDPDGTECIGCGAQEQFYGCADVAILPAGGDATEPTSSPATTIINNPTTTAINNPTTTVINNPITTVNTAVNNPTTAVNKPTTTDVNNPTTTIGGYTTTVTSTTPSSGQVGDCRSTGAYSGNRGMTKWCRANCPRGYCPSTHCACSPVRTTTTAQIGSAPVCIAVGAWTGDHAMDGWCRLNCAKNYCPPNHCKCA